MSEARPTLFDQAGINRSTRGRLPLVIFYGILVPVLIIIVLAGIGIGSTSISWSTIIHVLQLKLIPHSFAVTTARVSRAEEVIVWLIRVPRVIVAFFVGAGLATAGVIMQGLFRNPLAEPGIIGAGAGAVLGGVISFVAGWSARTVIVLPLLAMLGAFLALALVYLMATKGGVTPVATLLLSGVAISALLGAISSLLLSVNIVNWQIAQDIVFWMMGGLDARTWTHVWLCAPFVIVGLLASLFQTRDLDLLQLGEETASSLGVNIESSKLMLALTAGIITGASVAVAGMVGFIGLVVPHGVRLVVGPTNRALLLASAVSGGALLVLCDIFARTLNPPTEIRLGIVTALLGGPVFIALLLRQHRQGINS